MTATPLTRFARATPPRGSLKQPWLSHAQPPRPEPLDPARELYGPGCAPRAGAVPLVVGGTDGSGTRGVVALLQRLGVHMVVEDANTLDVHGREMGGWPAVVGPVLAAARSADYELETLPAAVRERAVRAVARFARVKARQACGAEPLARDIARELGTLAASRVAPTRARGVAFGFKAPVSMLLVPVLARVLGPFKFVHVLRDGRDLAFSDNQSPVNRFYNDTFGAAAWARHARWPPARALELWSKWNGGVRDWAARHATTAANLSDARGLN